MSINGHVVKELATQVSPTDEVEVDGKPVQPADGVVVAFHKPKGYICSRGDTHDRATIYAILPPQYQTLHYVGRLDKESEGLLLLTNRGELSQRLTHPSEGVEKEYEVTIDSDFEPEHKLKLLRGMITEEGFAKAERVWVDSARRINVVLKQGLKRQIRLMFYQLGYEVERLVRRRIGGLYLKGMPKGAWKELTDAEVQRYFIKHKEREPAPRAVKAKKAGEDGDDHIASEPASAAPFKLRPGPKTTIRKPRSAAHAGDSEVESKPRFGKKPGRAPGGLSRSPSRKPARADGDDEAPSQPKYDSDMPGRARPSPHKPKRFTKARELRDDRPSDIEPRKPRRSSGGATRPFSKPERIVDEEAQPRRRTGGLTERQAERKRFGERTKSGGKPAFAKKTPFKAGNKPSRKGKK